MCNSEILNILFSILTIIFAYLAFRQDKKAMKLQIEIAKREGALDRPNLELSLFKKPIRSNKYYLFLPFQNNNIFQFPFKFVISNTGTKRAKNVEFNIKGSTAIIHDFNEFTKQEYNFSNIKHKLISLSDFINMLCFHIDYIDQKGAIELILKTHITAPTDNLYNDDFKTKDNQLINVTYRINYMYQIDLWLTAENHKPSTSQFYISFIDSSHDSILEYFKNKSISNYEKYKDKQRNHNWLTRILQRILSGSSQKPTIDIINIIYLDNTPDLVDNISVVNRFITSQGAISSDGFLALPFLKYSGYPGKKI